MLTLQALPVAESLSLPGVQTPHSDLHPLEPLVILPANPQGDAQLELLRLPHVQQGPHHLYQVVRVPGGYTLLSILMIVVC